MTPTHPEIKVRSIVFDCSEPAELADFYAELLDGRVHPGDDDWYEVHFEGLPIKLAFQRIESYSPPQWPEGVPQQIHLDLTTTDLQAASDRAVALGAKVLGGPVQEPGCTFIVHADPSGHPFCFCKERRSD